MTHTKRQDKDSEQQTKTVCIWVNWCYSYLWPVNQICCLLTLLSNAS